MAHLQIAFINTLNEIRDPKQDQFRIITQKVDNTHFWDKLWSKTTVIFVLIIIAGCIMCYFIKPQVEKAYSEQNHGDIEHVEYE